MKEPIVEHYREHYPMTFYSQSLTTILNSFREFSSENDPLSCLESIPICIVKLHYYQVLKSTQFFLVITGMVILILTIVVLLIANTKVKLLFSTLTTLVFISTFIIENYIKVFKSDLQYIDIKIRSRKYYIQRKISNQNSSEIASLFNSLKERDGIYNFEIDNQATKGFSEAYFLHHLNQWFAFPWRILEHCRFEDDRGYTPTADFILINDDLKLGIDIEIDEPYSFVESMPIHLAEDPKYIYRDKFFLSLGYIVIRFAEYQIATYPHYCCAHIVKVLNQFLDQDTRILQPDLIEIESLTPQQWRVKTWTCSESQKMADNKVRDLYLEPVRLFNS